MDSMRLILSFSAFSITHLLVRLYVHDTLKLEGTRVWNDAVLLSTLTLNTKTRQTRRRPTDRM